MMIRILFALLIFPVIGFSQVYVTQDNPNQFRDFQGSIQARKNMRLPVIGGHSYTAGDSVAFIRYDPITGNVYYFNGVTMTWIQWGSGGAGADSNIFATLYRVDTAKTNLRTSINGKLNITDTAGKWIGIGTLSSLVKYGDTAAMLLPYARKADFIDSMAAHWTAIQGKQAQLNGTGFVKATGTTISYDNSTYTPTSRTLTINGVTQDLSADRIYTLPVIDTSKFVRKDTLGTAAYQNTGTSGATIPLLNGNNTASGTWTFNNSLTTASRVVLGGNTGFTISQDYDEFGGGTGFTQLRLTVTGDYYIGGWSSASNGQIMFMTNTGTGTLSLLNQHGAATAAQRFEIGDTIFLAPQQTKSFFYDGNVSRWRLLSSEQVLSGYLKVTDTGTFLVTSSQLAELRDDVTELQGQISHKVDSNIIRNDSLFWYAGGVEYFGGGVSPTSPDSSLYTTITRLNDSLNILKAVLVKAHLQGGNSFGRTDTIGSNDDQDVAMKRNGSIKLRVTSAFTYIIDKISIGKNTSSGATLEVQGSSSTTGSVIDIRNSSNGVIIQGLSNGSIYFGGPNIYIDAANTRLGIGQDNPSERLHVFGNSRVSGTSRVEGLSGTGDGVVTGSSNGTLNIIRPPSSGTYTLTGGDAIISWNESVRDTTATGDLTFSVPANSVLQYIVVVPVANETITVGTTNAGTDVVSSTPVLAGVVTTISVDKKFSKVAATTLYINGAAGAVDYEFYYK